MTTECVLPNSTKQALIPWVSCYSEDMSETAASVILVTNERLAELVF